MNKKFIRGYGFGGYSTMFTFAMYTTYGLYFYTDVVGIAPAYASLIVTLGTLWDAITDPLIGVWSDRRTDPRGKRRPVILGILIPFGVVSWLLFTDWHFSTALTIAYFAVITMAFYTVQTFLDVSYSAIASEVTTDYDVRSKLSTSRGIWETVAMIMSCFIISSTKLAGDLVGNARVGWSIMAGIFALISMLTIFLVWKSTAGCEKPGVRGEYADMGLGMNAWKLFFGSLKNETFRSVVAMYALGIISQSVYCSYNTYYCLNNLALTEAQTSVTLLFLWCGGMVMVPIIDRLMNRFGKKAAWLITVGIMSLSYLIFPLLVLREHSMIGMCLHSFIISAGFQAFYLVPWAMIPDTVEVEEYRSGERHEGLYYGLAGCVQKISSAIAFSICGIVLELIHYNSELAVQAPETILGLRIAMSIGCAVPLIISLFVAAKNPMSKELHEKYLEGIARKKAGLPTDDLGIH